MFEADQFEQREERDDDFGAAGGVGEHFGELDGGAFAEGAEEQFDFFADGPFVLKNVARFLRVETLEDRVDGVDQVEDRDDEFGRGGFDELRFAGLAGVGVFLKRLAFLEARGDVLEFLVLDEAADEFPARVLNVVFFLGGIDLEIDGEEFAALDVHERRGHHEELAGNVEVELAHQLDVPDELGRDLGDVDVVNVHLLLFHKVEEQIERSFEDLELDFVFRH